MKSSSVKVCVWIVPNYLKREWKKNSNSNVPSFGLDLSLVHPVAQASSLHSLVVKKLPVSKATANKNKSINKGAIMVPFLLVVCIIIAYEETDEQK